MHCLFLSYVDDVKIMLLMPYRTYTIIYSKQASSPEDPLATWALSVILDFLEEFFCLLTVYKRKSIAL